MSDNEMNVDVRDVLAGSVSDEMLATFDEVAVPYSRLSTAYKREKFAGPDDEKILGYCAKRGAFLRELMNELGVNGALSEDEFNSAFAEILVGVGVDRNFKEAVAGILEECGNGGRFSQMSLDL